MTDLPPYSVIWPIAIRLFGTQEYGSRPLITTIVRQRRLRLAGHVTRHDEDANKVLPWTYIYWTASSALCANEFDFAPAADTLSCLLPASPVECKWRSSCTDQNVKKRWQQLLHAIVDCACTSAKCRGLSTEGNRMESPFAACHHWYQ